MGPATSTSGPSVARFLGAVLDLRTGELRREGVLVQLQPQPAKVLALLIRHAGQVVSREDIVREVWGSNTFVDFDQGLNYAIRQIRSALQDDADAPRFVETLHKRGYRFIAPLDLDKDLAQDDLHPAPVSEESAKPVREPEHRGLRTLASIAAVAIAALLLLYLLRPEMPSPRVSRIVQLTKSGGAGGPWYNEPLYTDGPRLYYRSFTQTTDRPLRQLLLNGNENTLLGVPLRFLVRGLSPDDTEFVALSLTDDHGAVWTIPVAGSGSPRRIGNLVADDIAWSHDGAWFAYSQGSQLFLAKSDGTSLRLLANVPVPSGRLDHIRWSPDDRRLRFTLLTEPTQALWEVGADGRDLHALRFPWPGAAEECCGEWTSDGRIFVFSSRREGVSNLWAQLEKTDWWRRPKRDPIQLTSGPVNYYQPVPSRNGKSIFAIGAQPSGELVRYDAGRKDFVSFLGGQSFDRVTFSHDGRWVAYVSYPEQTLWRARSDGSEPLQLTFPALEAGNPRWSPDGKWIAFQAIQSGQPWKCFVVSADGGNPEPFPQEPSSQAVPDWMPGESDSLIFSRALGADGQALYLFDRRSERTEKIPGTEGLYGPRWSPDGSRLAASDAAKGDLYLVDLKTGKRTQIAGQVWWPSWSANSQYIYFRKKDNGRWIFSRVHVPDGKEEEILDPPFRLSTGTFTLAPDGSPLMLREHGHYDLYALHLSVP
jgi:Tol biopolymer transport system component/DNA-binding winged helix-turn-helix (wHTH) protein